MGKLSMCRICVAENVRMHVVTDGNLHDVYEKLTDVPFVSEDRRPMVACYLCYVKLKQCYRLMKQCVQAEEVFTRMLSLNQEENYLTKRQDGKYLSELTITAVAHINIDNNPIDSDSIKQECMDMCETQYDGEQTKEDSNDNVKQEDDSLSNQKYLLPLRNEECSLDDEPLMFFKSEDEGVQVIEKVQRAVKKGTPAAIKPKLDIRRATLRDIITDTQTRHEIRELELCHISENIVSESVSELIEPSTHETVTKHVMRIRNKTKKVTEIIEEVNIGAYNNRCNDIIKGSNSDGITGYHSSCSKQKLFTCEICQRTFKLKSNFETHVRIHTGEKPYKCDICQHEFTQSSGLKVHIRKHSGEKPYKCQICHRGFSTRGNLKIHIRTHTGEKPHTCEICHRGFSQRTHLESHLRIHTGEKPYKCDKCQRGFTNPSNLERHGRKCIGGNVLTKENDSGIQSLSIWAHHNYDGSN